jgi:hypothetical protein
MYMYNVISSKQVSKQFIYLLVIHPTPWLILPVMNDTDTSTVKINPSRDFKNGIESSLGFTYNA